MTDHLKAIVEAAWEDRDTVGVSTKGDVRQAVDAAKRPATTGSSING